MTRCNDIGCHRYQACQRSIKPTEQEIDVFPARVRGKRHCMFFIEIEKEKRHARNPA